MKSTKKVLAVMLAVLVLIGAIPTYALAARAERPTIGEFKNHKDNEKNRFTFDKNASGNTVISYKTSTNWDITEASVSCDASEYTRLCLTAKLSGTKQFGIEAKVPENPTRKYAPPNRL